MTRSSKAKDYPPLIIAYEFALGLIELLLGLAVAFYGHKVVSIYAAFKSSDILGEQHDLLADTFEKVLPYFFTHRAYIILFLVALGVVKITSSIGLWLGKEWGKHLLIGLLVVIIPFDLAAIIRQFSWLDVGYLIIDILIGLYMIEFQPRKYILEVKRLLFSKSN